LGVRFFLQYTLLIPYGIILQLFANTKVIAGDNLSVPFFTLSRQYESIKDEVDTAIAKVLAEGHFIMGPEVTELEKRLADYLGVKHVISMANGTDALVIALDVLGVGPGDEVITTPYTFFASAECISHRGATPVFVDVDRTTFTIDPEEVRKAITPRTRAVIPVHLFGQPCDMGALMAIAREHGIYVVEDCAQAIGAACARKKVGTIGDIGCFSLFPTKNLGCYGDGGFVVTDSDEWAAVLRKKRTHGSNPKYYHDMLGYNSRLDTIQAAIVLAKLPHLDSWNARRLEIARRYNEAFAGLPVHLPKEAAGRTHVYHLYMFGAPDRDKLKNHLEALGIGSGIYYPLPLHLQQVYKDMGYKTGSLPNAEDLSPSMLALPCYPEMTGEEQQQVIDAVKSFLNKEVHK
jgi:dTDP-4-amino-4,6-dideoxygalactose transaminase